MQTTSAFYIFLLLTLVNYRDLLVVKHCLSASKQQTFRDINCFSYTRFNISSLPEFAEFRVDKFNLLKTVLKFLCRKRITQSIVELWQSY